VRLDLTAKRAAIVVQQIGKRGIQEFTPWQDDEVETSRRLVMSVEFAHPAFRTIAPNRLA
jgi:hypothetical protein|tara:strand:+ start:3891 stop:4070 length:180 start_codon:yes stop_codon:yes gene_type:complete